MLDYVNSHSIQYLNDIQISFFNFSDRVLDSNSKINLINKRIDVIKKPFLLRFFGVINLLINGVSNNFSGIKSAFRDMFYLDRND